MSLGMKRVGIQTWAMFVDAYRELNSKKLFWISLGISGLIVGIFALTGIDEKGLTFGPWHLGTGRINSDLITPAQMYKSMFVQFGIGVWMSWAAIMLALVSTAGIFPDFLASGSIDVLLSKPIGRLRLFLTKYMTGLFFVGFQILVFALAAILVIGVRGGEWEFGMLVSVPLVTLMFSYLFAVMVLVGVVTRSTIASLLVTGVVWAILFVSHTADVLLMTQHETTIMDRERLEMRLDKFGEDAIARSRLEERLEEARDAERKWGFISKGMSGALTLLPKTSETVDLISRMVVASANLPEPVDTETGDSARDPGPMGMNLSFRDRQEIGRRVEARLARRSVGWVLGTSIAFEALVVGLGAWRFVRRDF